MNNTRCEWVGEESEGDGAFKILGLTPNFKVIVVAVVPILCIVVQ